MPARLDCFSIARHTVKAERLAVGFHKNQFLDHYVLNSNQPVSLMAQHLLSVFYFDLYFFMPLSDEGWVSDWLIDIFCERSETYFKCS